MKRFALPLVVALLVAPASARSAGLPPRAVATVSQFAYATNIVHIGHFDYMILAGARRVTNPAGSTHTTAFAKRSKCATLKKEYFKVIACATFVRPHKVAESAFQFDPALDSAALSLRRKGRPTKVSWRGVHLPSPDGWPEADPSYGASLHADAYRDARADGRIMGVDYRTRHFGAFALLVEGGEAGVRGVGPVEVHAARSGGLVFEARYRVPRRR